MDFSIVLATYKRPGVLRRTLQSFIELRTGGLHWEVLVVDNAGDAATEAEVELSRDKLPVHYLVELKNGKNNALNHAIPKIRGDLVVLADDDIIADPSWLLEIQLGAARWPQNAVFGGRVLPDWPDGFDPPQPDNPFLAGAYGIADWSETDCLIEPDQVFGANMVVRRRVFDEGWTFDGAVGPSSAKAYRMGSETEFLLRLAAAGHSFVYLPKALVYHQIRPDQMSLAWLKNRARRAGGSGVCLQDNHDDCPVCFGVPRYLLRMVTETWCELLCSRLTFSKRRVEHEMRLQHLLGQIAMYRQMTGQRKAGSS